MARQNPVVTSFNSGEWSPLMYGRHDLAKHANACRRMENMLATVQGPAKRRGGTYFVAYQKTSDQRAWLSSFRFSANQAYILEFGPAYVRFFVNRAQLLSGNAPYEIASPYTAGDLTTDDKTFGLNFEQVGDVVYCATGAREARKLTRITPTNWTLQEHRPQSGPFADINPDKTVRISMSGREGTVTATASAALFTPQHVGMLLRVDLENVLIAPWEPGKKIEPDGLRRSDGKTYKATNADSLIVTGTKLPIHEDGIVYDGSGFNTDDTPKPVGIAWQFQDPGYGIGRITGYSSPTEVVVAVQTGMPFPESLVGVPSNVWQIGAWGDAAEFPRHVARFKNRLAYASRRRTWLSVPGDYEDFARDIVGEVRDDAGITRELDATDAIAWMIAAEALVFGTESTELLAQKQTAADPLSPSNFDSDIKSGFGSRFLKPERVGMGIVQVDKSGRRIREMRYSSDSGQYESMDLTVLAEHITRGGVVDWAFQKQPDRVLWVVLDTGELVALTIEREQDVLAAHRHPTDGLVKAVEALPAPDGTRDDLWLIVERALGGERRRCIEVMDKGRDDGAPLAESFFVDCGLTYRGAPSTVISGLGHLVGREVSILADGASHPKQVVASDGTITLRYAASIVHVGLPMRALLEPMTLTPGSPAGKTERAYLTQMLVHETVGGKMGPTLDKLRPIAGRSPFVPDGDPQPLVSDYVELFLEGGHSRRASVLIVQDEPLPMTICCLCPEVEKNARP